MGKKLLKKGIVFAIILLFVGTSCGSVINHIPTTQDNTIKTKNNNEKLSLDSTNQNIMDNSAQTMGSGNFWIDLHPNGVHDGGKFENDDYLWDITTQITQDDFDDTGNVIDWATLPGIYSEIRPDEDLWDGTTDKGAWCTAAAEAGGLWAEDSRGYAYIYNPAGFSIDQYANSSLPQFQITSATLYCDYKIDAWDFDSDENYVYFNILIHDWINDQWDFFEFQEHSYRDDAPNNIGHGYPGDGWCTDFWDGEDGYNPNESVDDYHVNTLSDDQTLAAYLNAQPYDSLFSIYFWLDIRLFGRAFMNFELFKFWIDDFAIYCEYTYDLPPNKPIITGPHFGEINLPLCFSTTVTDPDGDNMYLLWNWGDETNHNWSDPVASGQTITLTHPWSEKGTYNVQLKLKDVYEMESNWSDPHLVTIYELNKAFMIGIFIPITSEEGFITIQAVYIITVQNTGTKKYTAPEEIIFSSDFTGIKIGSFIAGFFEIAV